MLDVTLILISVCAATFGLIAGLLIGRKLSSDGQKLAELESKLGDAQREHSNYKGDVAQHFNDTAKLLNHLTESYREVHAHLATGAHDLCDGKGPVIPGRLADDGEALPDLADIQPPLDYAPKASPDQEGVLSENFGIEKQADEADDVPTPPPTEPAAPEEDIKERA